MAVIVVNSMMVMVWGVMGITVVIMTEVILKMNMTISRMVVMVLRVAELIMMATAVVISHVRS